MMVPNCFDVPLRKEKEKVEYEIKGVNKKVRCHVVVVVVVWLNVTE